MPWVWGAPECHSDNRAPRSPAPRPMAIGGAQTWGRGGWHHLVSTGVLPSWGHFQARFIPRSPYPGLIILPQPCGCPSSAGRALCSCFPGPLGPDVPARAEARAVYKQSIRSESLAEPTEGTVSFQAGIWAGLADVISYRKEISGQCQEVAGLCKRTPCLSSPCLGVL